MTRKNITRRAFVTSVIALILCCSMLVGTTFAWFTDSVASGMNHIRAGNLDVELYHSDKAVQNEPVNNSVVLFDDVKLWEPGAVVYENLQVKNEGNLALKYQLNLNFDNATDNGAGKTLADVLKVAVVKDGFYGDRAAAQKLTFTHTLSTFTLSGELEEGQDSRVYGIVICWLPGANDNDFNMNNGKTGALTIDLGVTLLATQKNHESDSFNPNYDQNAWDDAMVVANEADLIAAVENSDKIMLAEDVELTAVLTIPEGKTVAINLNGKTISNASGNAIVNKGTLTLTGNGTVTSATTYALNNSGSLTVENGTFSGIFNGGALAVDDGTVANVISGRHGIYHSGSALTINDGTFSSTSGNELIHAAASNVTINGGTFNMVGKSYLFGPQNAGIVINNGTFNGYVNDNGTNDKMRPGAATVSGGIFNFDPTAWLADGYTAVDNGDGTWVIKTEGTEFVTAGLYKNGTTYYIESANGLSYLGEKALTGNNGTAEAVVYELQNNIDMGGANFSSIIAQRGDSLTFNGNGYTISNVNIVSGAEDNSTGQAGMFYCYNDSTLTVSDLTLKDITVTADKSGNGYASAVIGFCEGAAVLTNVDVVNATVIGEKSSGMLCGHVGNGGSLTATNCDVSGSVTLDYSDNEPNGHYAGKLVGTIADPVALNNCTANVTVSGSLHAKNVGNIYGRITGNGSLTIDGAAQKSASSQAELTAAVASGNNVDITLSAGEYTLPSTAGKTVTISGTSETKIDVSAGYYADTANLTFNGVTISGTDMGNPNGGDYELIYSENATFINCIIDGAHGVGRDGAKYIGCTFNLPVDYVWTFASDVTFEGCTFNSQGKALLLYNHGGSEMVNVVVKNCVFNATGGAKAGAIANQNCAAIEIDNYGCSFKLTAEGNTVDDDFSGEWRIKSFYNNGNTVTVNNVSYTTIAIDGKTMTIDANKNVTVNN